MTADELREPTATDASVPLWSPTPESIAASTMAAYLRFLDQTRGLAFDGYPELWRWSVEHLEDFWASVWEYFGLSEESGYDAVLPDRSMPGARWFTGAHVNFAQRCLAVGAADHPALVVLGEEGEPTTTTYAELRTDVARLAGRLRALGVGPGDYVAGYLPNVPEAVVALLAAASIGAVWTVVSPDLGTSAARSRLEQVGPKVLVAAPSYRYGGKLHDRRSALSGLVAKLPTLTHVVLADSPQLPDAEEVPGWAGLEPSGLPAAPAWVGWDALPDAAPVTEFAQLPFDHPLWVLWSSGTTGAPKGIVQGHGGITVELLKALALHSDVRADDRYFFITSTSWMVWNFLVGGLLLGSTVILYDGSPTYPDVDGAWRVAELTGATVMGSGAAYLLAGHKAGATPGRRYDLGALRSLLQTGSTLPTETWHWVSADVRPGIWLQSISGGTDVCSVLVGANPLQPVYAGCLQGAYLGAAADSWDPHGQPVRNAEGELVITEPLPSMPLYFVGDPDGARYHDAYFAVYPGVWRHGDFVTIRDDGSVVISGRSDATLNRMGIRMGSADIYGVVETVDGVADSLVLGVELPNGGYWMPLFVVPAPGRTVDDELRGRIVAAIRQRLSPRHVPDEIIGVRAVPRTLTGKKLEVPIKRILQGQGGSSAPGAVTDPDMLAWFEELAKSRR